MKNNYTNFKSITKSSLLIASFLLLLCNVTSLYGQVKVPFTQRTSVYSPTKKIYNVKGDFTMAGNTNLTLDNYGDDLNNNNIMKYVDVDGVASTWNSSSSNLVFSNEFGADPNCSNIVYAGLYWTGRASDGADSPNIFTATRQVPGPNTTINTNYTIGHNQSVTNTSYTLNVTRDDPSNNNRSPIYTFSNGTNTYVFRFTNNTGANRVTVSVNGGSASNVGVSYSTSGSNGTATFNTPYQITDGSVILKINSLVRDTDTDNGTTTTQNTSFANVNVSGTIPTFITESKTFNKRVVSLKGPTSSSYTTITANTNDIYYPTTEDGFMYSAYAEVTDYVRANGLGAYTVADIAVIEGNGGGTGYYGGWGLVVVYENSKMKWRDVTIFDGHSYVAGSVTADFEIPISGFNTAPSGPINMKLGMIAGEGDRNIAGDYFQIRDYTNTNWIPLNHAGNSTGNFFNSSIFTGGNTRNPALLNNTGLDISMFNIPNTNNSVISNNQTSTKFKYGSTQDTFVIFNITMSVDAYVPDDEGILVATAVNNVPISNPSYSTLPGDIISFSLNIRNLGTEAINNHKIVIPIPYNATYVAGSAVGNVLFTPLPTPNNIYFDANLGATGSIVWDFGTLPLPANASTLLANLTFKLKTTTDCAILQNLACGNQISINGYTSGVGAITNIPITNSPFIQGYTQNGNCIGEPIPQPLNIPINGTAYVNQNCLNQPLVRNFTFCNSNTTVAVSEIASNFPLGSTFYNEFPITPTSIQYSASNPFPLVSGTTATFYAVPPFTTNCSFPFTLTKCGVIVANNDTGTTVNGFSGGTSFTNVLVNDTLNGNPIVASQVNTTFVSSTNPGVTLSGTNVVVAAGTPSGSYTLTYQICEIASPANCDPATVTVTVINPVINAVNDAGTSVNGYTGGTAFTNVLINDTLNGVAVVPSQVTTTFVSSTNAGVTLSGTNVLVAAGTPAGSYTLTYQICQVTNPTNCDTAIVTVPVGAPTINAVNDAGTSVNGYTGGTAFTNVLINDTLNGVAVVPSQVTTTFVSSTNAGVTLSGTNVVVAAGTPAGSYTLTYQICQVTNPTNCDTAIVTVPVGAPTINAVNDAGTSVNGYTGGTAFTNVLINDTLNGVAVVPSQVTTTFVSSTNAGVTLSGTNVLVAAGTPAGSYTLTYQICQVTNPTNCDTAIVTVPVGAPTIDAVNDAGTSVNGYTGGTALTNVLANDTLNGVAVVPSQVTTTFVSSTNAGVTLSGTNVLVAAGTPAGSYTLTYQICQVTNPTNCDTAIVTVPVGAPTINAVNDAGTSVNGYTGGTAFTNVLINDTLNGVAVVPSQVTTTFVSSTNAGVTLSGTNVLVAAGTPAGNYTLTYQICQVTNPTNCDTAIVTVPVGAPTIDAVNDAGTSVNGYTGGTAFTNVLTNDTLNGVAVVPSQVTTTFVSSTNAGVTLSGTNVLVAAGTPAGNYTLTYQICQVTNPTNCDTAIVTVPVGAPTIDAVNDAGTSVNGYTGGTALTNVLANDTLNGVAVVPSQVTTTFVSSTNAGVTLSGTNVLVAAGTPAGSYTLTYQICQVTNPTNCDTAIVTVPVGAPTINAVNDAGTSVNGYTGGTAFTNVLINDTLNGVAVVPSQVTTTFVSSTNAGVTLSGTNVLVAAGTPAGNYTLTYQICQVTNPTNCDTAIVTVPVGAPTIDAVNDAGTSVNGYTGGTAFTNVLTNDTLNGVAVVPSQVTTTFVSSTNAGVTLSGTNVLVAAGTPAGSYTLTYQICQVTNPTNCDTAIVTVPVGAPTINAVNDAGTSVNGYTGGTAFTNVLINDTLNGVAVVPSQVTTTFVSSTNAGVTLSGTNVLVAAGTPAGNYTLTYQICQVTNPTNCDTAIVTVPVGAPTIDAVNDAGTSVNGYTGGTAFTNVLTNDTLNGVAVVPSQVTTTFVSSTNAGVTLSGTNVLVAAGTPAGNYTLTYQICQVTNPTNCDTAIVTVPVGAPTIDAVNDAGTSVNGYTGGTALTNVLANDTLNGVAVVPSQVTTTFVSSTNAGVTLSGTNVLVAAGTPAGSYTLTYQICQVTNPTNCDTAIVTVPVGAPTIDAVNDAGTSVNGYTGGTAFTNVLTNDTLNGVAVVPSQVTTTFVSSTNAGVTLSGTNVLVAAGTPAGNYTLTYQICQVTNPTNCDTAIVTVPVGAPTIDAVNDAGTSVNGYTGGTALTNVLANDTLNGVAVVPSQVTTTFVSSTNAGVTLSGTNVLVAAGTPAGSYTLTYQICQVTNPTNCDTAIVTVPVGAPTINAVNDAGTSVNGYTGGTALTNVLANDTLNGVAVVPSQVTTTFVSSTNAGVTLSGTNVLVAAGTPAGNYTLTYQICQVTNPTNCDTAIVTVPVGAPTIDAVNDAGTSVNGYTGGTALTNVLANDTLNGVAVVPSQVTTTFVSSTNAGVTLSGTNVLVAAGTPAGSYTLTYQICQVTNPTNCDTAIVTVPVGAPTINAVNDAGTSVNGYTGGTAFTNVLINDTLNGVAVVPSQVTTTFVSSTNAGVTLSGTNVLVAAGTPAGSYTLTYQICQVTNPTNCDTAIVTVPVYTPSIELLKEGTYVDSNLPTGVSVGDTITYAFTVTNTSTVALTNITVTDPLVTVVGGPLAILAAGAFNSTTFTAVYTVTQADIDAGQVNNLATATGTPPSGPPVTDTSSDPTPCTTCEPVVGCPTCTSTDLPANPSIQLLKDGTYVDSSLPAGVSVGDTITYAFTVTNTGNVTLTNVTVTDPLVTVLGGPIPTLAVGASNSTTFTAVYTVTQADIDAGQVNNLATTTGTPPSGPPVTDTSSDPTPCTTCEPVVGCPTCTSTDLPANPSIQLLKDGTYVDSSLPAGVSVGDTITYAFTVTNTGNVTLTNVTVTDPLVTVVGGPIPTLAVGASNSTTFTAVYTVTQADIDAGQVNNLATTTGTPPSGPPVTDTSSDPTPCTTCEPVVGCPTCTSTDLPANPSIQLLKDGTYVDSSLPTGVSVGDTITYAFTVTNTGNVTLTNVTVTDPLVTVVGGPIPTLAVGAFNSTTFTAVYTVTQADIDAGQVNNLATATGTPPSGPPVTDTSSDPTPCTTCEPVVGCPTCTSTDLPANPSIQLLKDGTYVDSSLPAGVSVGDTITYAFTVTNTGNVTLTNVTVTDPLVTVLGGPIPTLAVGASNSTTFTAVYTVTQADIDAGQVNNLATTTGTPPSGPPVTDTSSDPTPCTTCEPVVGCPTCTSTDLPANPSIQLLKDGTYVDSSLPAGVSVGDTITYAFTVTNTGNVTLTNVTVTDPLVTVVGGPIPTLAVGASNSTTFTAVYTVTQADIDAGQVNNLATTTGTPPSGPPVTDTSSDPTPCTTCEPVVGCPTCTSTDLPANPSIQLLKDGTYVDSSLPAGVSVGDTITYAFTVTNTGNVTLTNVTVTDPLVTVVGGPIPTLAVGASNSTTFTAVYTVTQADIDAGQVNNLATTTGTPPSGPPVTDTSSDPTPCTTCEPVVGCPTCTSTDLPANPSIQLLKDGTYVDSSLPAGVSVGDTITYAFTVTNTGNVTLTNVTVTDPLVTVVGGPIPTLAVGASNSTTFTAVYTVTQADIDAGQVNNLATATGTPPSGPPVTDTSSDPTPCTTCEPVVGCPTCTSTDLPANPSIQLLKDGTYVDSSLPAGVSVGDTITYAFTVTNTGNVTLTNVTVTDPLVTVVGGPIPTLAVGASNSTTFTAVYTVTQADIDAGQVNNLATATGTPPSGPPVTDTSSDPTPCTTCEPVVGCPTCTSTDLPANPSIQIIKDGVYVDNNGDGITNAGDTVTYTFTVTNTGNVTLTNVTVIDNNAVVTGGPIPTLAVGASDSTTFTAVHTITVADILAGQVNNLATATGTPPSGPPVTDTSSDPTPCTTCEPVVGCPSCTITPLIDAVNDTYNSVACDGTGTIGNILSNDTYGSNPVNSNSNSQVTLTILSGNNPNIIIDNSGAITMTSAVPVGSYTYTYQICSTVSPNTCDIATVIINIIDTTDPTWTTPSPLPQDVTVSCSNVPVTPILTATDSCSTPTVTHVQVITPGNCPGNYTIVNTWTATDGSNNDIVHVQTITVQDTTAPTFVETLPTNITVECSAVPTAPTLTATDNCGTATVAYTETTTAGSCAGSYTLTRTWIATDLCGLTTTHVQTITVQDTTAPTFVETLPTNITVECSAVPTAPTLTATDNCGTATVAYTETTTAGSCAGSYTLTRTWIATDLCGLTTTHVQTITVQDTTAPAFVEALPVDAMVECSAVPTAPTLTATDNCGTATVAYTETTTAGFCAGSYTLTRTWIATDLCGLTTTHVQTITVQDTTAPTFVEALPTNVTVECSAVPTAPTLTATDNCGTATVAYSQTTTAGSCAGSYTLTRTWIATDACGLATTHVQTITVQDTTPPTFVETLPTNVTVECSAVPTAPTLTATDNCGTATVAYTETTTAGSCAGSYTLTRTWIATDACGLATTHVQTITVQDTTAPTFVETLPTNVTVECSAVPTAPTLTATDNCGTATVAYTETTTAGSCAGSYTLTRTWTATDLCGLATTHVQTITVQDTTAPTFVETLPTNITVECSAVPTAVVLTATDNCGTATVAYTETTTAGSCAGSYTLTRTWTATDLCGLATTHVQTITVQDTTAPTFVETLPTNITVECSAVPTAVVLTATDNCGTATVAYTETTTAGSCAGSYTLTRTWTATDLCGLATTHVQTITVQDTTAPTFVETLPTNVTVECSAVPTAPTLTATDNCGTATVAYTETTTAGSCAGSYTLTRTWIATDLCGLSTTHVQTITVQDTTAPTFVETLPTNVTVECSAVPTAPTLTATDNCGTATVAYSQTTTAGSCAGSYTLTRTWTATDLCGLATTHVQTITVQDTTAPTFVETLPTNVTVECSAVPTAPTLTATDNCGTATVAYTETTTAGSCAGSYTLTRTWIATDLCGLATTHVQTITVQDTTAPVLTSTLDAVINVNCDAIPDMPVLVFSDACSTSSDITITSTETPSEVSENGSYTIIRTWTASDSCNNQSTVTQTVNVTISNFFRTMVIDSICTIDIDLIIDIADEINTQYPGVVSSNGTYTDVSNSGALNESTGEFTPLNLADGDYIVRYENNDPECPRVIEITLKVSRDFCEVADCVTLVVHNAFTPNGDGTNEYFSIENITDPCYAENTVEIYNRWGVLVYEVQNYNNADKAFRGISEGRNTVKQSSELPNGTYFYILKYRTIEGDHSTEKGYLYLTR